MTSDVSLYLTVTDLPALNAARHGRSYRSVAAEAGCSTSFLWGLFAGVQRRVSPELAARIEAALDAPTGTLFVPDPAALALLQGYL